MNAFSALADLDPNSDGEGEDDYSSNLTPTSLSQTSSGYSPPSEQIHQVDIEEDNNPFVGTNHLYASGIATVNSPDMNTHLDTNAFTDNIFLPDPLEEEEQEDGEEELPTTTTEEHSSYHINVSPSNYNYNKSVINSHLDEPFETLSISMANSAPNSNNYDDVDTDDSKIQIIESGDYKDPWGKHAIGYCIQFNKKRVTRRYSEFDSLYQVLKRLLPTIVIPPIPTKHPLINYLINPINVNNDTKIIDKRKRKFNSFLNNCNDIPEIRNHVVFQKFLNSEYTWKDILNSSPIIILPLNNLLAPPLNPVKPSPLHLLLPAPAPP